MDYKSLTIGILTGIIISLIIWIVFLRREIEFHIAYTNQLQLRLDEFAGEAKRMGQAYDIITTAMRQSQRKK